MPDIFSPDRRRQLMSRVKNKNTDIELILRKKLWNKGYRYRINYKIFGSPDIAFPKLKIAIFCDGDFWHGRSYKVDKFKYKPFWKDKIGKNVERDKTVNKQLEKEGWIVLRFWKAEILKNIDRCVDRIEKYLV